MVIIEEGYRQKVEGPDRSGAAQRSDWGSPRKIIDFELGRKMLEKISLEKSDVAQQSWGRTRRPKYLPDDWVELLITVGTLLAILLGLYAGLG